MITMSQKEFVERALALLAHGPMNHFDLFCRAHRVCPKKALWGDGWAAPWRNHRFHNVLSEDLIQQGLITRDHVLEASPASHSPQSWAIDWVVYRLKGPQ